VSRRNRGEWRRIGGAYRSPLWDLAVFVLLLAGSFALCLVLAQILQMRLAR
jgi:hypothetical protein